VHARLIDDLKRFERRRHDQHRLVRELLEIAEPAQQFERRQSLGRVRGLVDGRGDRLMVFRGMSGWPLLSLE
jgi:hypothetical protein